MVGRVNTCLSPVTAARVAWRGRDRRRQAEAETPKGGLGWATPTFQRALAPVPLAWLGYLHAVVSNELQLLPPLKEPLRSLEPGRCFFRVICPAPSLVIFHPSIHLTFSQRGTLFSYSLFGLLLSAGNCSNLAYSFFFSSWAFFFFFRTDTRSTAFLSLSTRIDTLRPIRPVSKATN